MKRGIECEVPAFLTHRTAGPLRRRQRQSSSSVGVCFATLTLLFASAKAWGFSLCGGPVSSSISGRRAMIGQQSSHPRHARSPQLRMADGDNDKEQKNVAEAEDDDGFFNPFARTFDAGRRLRETLDAALDQITGKEGKKGRLSAADVEQYERMLYSQFDSEDEIPEVLVVGATGETGRVVVRKLLLRGFRVRVLVRNLFSSTLDLLGTGVTYTQGDLTNRQSIVDAVSGVDKVIFCAQSRELTTADSAGPAAVSVEYEGFKNLVHAFQDARVADYGQPYSTKRTLFRFTRQVDRELWQLSSPSYQRVTWLPNKFNHGTLGSIGVANFGYVGVESQPLGLNLGPFSGFVIRALGDGKVYKVIVRTDLYASAGIQFEANIQTQPNRWLTHRLPFSDFEPYKDGELVSGESTAALDRRNIQQLGVAYYRRPADGGGFILSLDYIKVYRTQLEPEFIYVSSASMPPGAPGATPEAIEPLRTSDPKAYVSARGEKVLRESGLTYTIVRIKGYNNAPGGIQAIRLQQDKQDLGLISRADLAEILVNSLLDPRACNLAFYASQGKFAPTAINPNRDLSTVFARMRPNT